ncbi:replication initiator [Streptomyces sp. PT12]|uniref:replication initiator n=1 Tax=Streptomyces sp. PT12 TaxID=1510197 RepID=UPI000DE325CD|nr:replication initiator [Streptomyces sp. PT12]RBM23800.1 replication initiation protein [Streptomyces sp. PT12]
MTAAEWADFSRWFERITAPDYREWEADVRRIGGCAHPVQLAGTVLLVDSATGEIVHELGSDERAPLLVPCGNRRRAWCAPCSRVYQWDTWHLVKAGLAGGKGVPTSVATHPRVLLTLTAPSFGPVHTLTPEGACRPRRDGGACEHGMPSTCWARHAKDDPLVGAPLCAECYDYAGGVLWNAHAGRLWHRFTDLMRRQELPRAGGVSKTEFARTARLSFVKVAEFQRRGLVHFHAVMRLDPPEHGEALPDWAGHDVIATAARRSAAGARVVTAPSRIGQRVLGWGSQVDVRPIPETDDTSAGTVAAYIAKYVTKAAEESGTVDFPLYCKHCRGTGLARFCHRCQGTGLRTPLSSLRVSPHIRELIATAWRLGRLPEFRNLKLRHWAHQLGYGGHFSTKSRAYSTTMTALRAARAHYRANQLSRKFSTSGKLIVDAELTYLGTGYASKTEEQIAEGIRDAIAENRRVAREALADLRAQDPEHWEPE